MSILSKSKPAESEEKAAPETHKAHAEPRGMDAYRIHGKWVHGKLHLTGPAADFLDLAKVCGEVATCNTADQNGNVVVQLDGEQNMPVKQSGN